MYFQRQKRKSVCAHVRVFVCAHVQVCMCVKEIVQVYMCVEGCWDGWWCLAYTVGQSI